MKNNNLSGIKMFGFLFLGIGIVYILYALYALCLVVVSEHELGKFFYLWNGFPFLIVGFLKLGVGTAFLKGVFRNLKLILIVVGALNITTGYFLLPWIDKTALIVFWLSLYTAAFVCLARYKKEP